jgi:hypothetical protein
MCDRREDENRAPPPDKLNVDEIDLSTLIASISVVGLWPVEDGAERLRQVHRLWRALETCGGQGCLAPGLRVAPPALFQAVARAVEAKRRELLPLQLAETDVAKAAVAAWDEWLAAERKTLLREYSQRTAAP